MTVALVRSELERFLSSKEPEVLCITGRWGVGKTYAWNELLGRTKKAGKIALTRYSYVSLFGINSIAEVKSAVAENTVELGSDTSPNVSTLKRNVDQMMEGAGAWRRLIRNLPLDAVPKGGALLGSFDRLLYLAMRQQLVCIDDLERAGKDLTPKTVLGLASQIKEQKQCKVVLLLNSDELTAEGKVEFQAHLEKVADSILSFEPTPAEAAEIAVSPGTSYAQSLSEACTRLQITNIRVIKKAERLCARAADLLAKVDGRILRSAVKTIALASYAKYQPGSGPTVQFLRDLDEYQAVLLASDPDEEHKRWMSLLADFEYTTTDTLDRELILAVESGVFDTPEIVRISQDQHYLLEANDREERLRDAWRLYRDSFDENEEEVCDALISAAVEAMDRLTPGDLSAVTTFLRRLDQDEVADKLIEAFVEHRHDEPEFWKLDEYSTGLSALDPAVVAAFERKHREVAPAPDIDAVVRRLSRDDAWGGNDLNILASLSVDDWRERLLAARGEDHRRLQRVGLRWRQISNCGPEMSKIVANCTAAMRQIAIGSRINTLRALDRGISLNGEAAE